MVDGRGVVAGVGVDVFLVMWFSLMVTLSFAFVGIDLIQDRVISSVVAVMQRIFFTRAVGSGVAHGGVIPVASENETREYVASGLGLGFVRLLPLAEGHGGDRVLAFACVIVAAFGAKSATSGPARQVRHAVCACYQLAVRARLRPVVKPAAQNAIDAVVGAAVCRMLGDLGDLATTPSSSTAFSAILVKGSSTGRSL